MAEAAKASGPDLSAEGVAVGEVSTAGMLEARVGDEAVVLLRTGDGWSALRAKCSHYGGPLGRGRFDGSSLRCPWHHACFDARTGRALRPPALDPVPAYRVEEHDGRLRVTGRAEPPPLPARRTGTKPESVVIIGSGAAGAVAAETLRAEGYEGPVTMVGSDPDGPVDRPNLSKDYLAGQAPEEWVPLRPPDFYERLGVELLTGRTVAAIEPVARAVVFADGERRPYGALLLATGGEPVRPPIPGAEGPRVHYLRTLADSRAIISAAAQGPAVIVGAGFIGLEAAASLRARGVEVHVVAPEAQPLARVLGPELGGLVQRIHEEHGVRFHLGRSVREIGEGGVLLHDGTRLAAGFVVVGTGIRPRVALARDAGLPTEDGVRVDRYLATEAPGIWAAGDIARWPHPRFGELRVEHWVVAQRQGQTAARNILGAGEPCELVPFFWSQHYDVRINYVGHAREWDETRSSGSLKSGLSTAYLAGGRVQALATIGRDADSLRAEAAFERGDEEALLSMIG